MKSENVEKHFGNDGQNFSRLLSHSDKFRGEALAKFLELKVIQMKL
jgi:hypothetical protein